MSQVFVVPPKINRALGEKDVHRADNYHRWPVYSGRKAYIERTTTTIGQHLFFEKDVHRAHHRWSVFIPGEIWAPSRTIRYNFAVSFGLTIKSAIDLQHWVA